MTDVAYMCHNCASVHEVESIRENLILDLRTATGYELPGQQGILDPRARFLRWRMTWGLPRLVLAFLGIRGPLRRASRIHSDAALRYQ